MNKKIRYLLILVMALSALLVATLMMSSCKTKEQYKPEINIEVMSINRENNTFSVVLLVDTDFEGRLLFTLENNGSKHNKTIDGPIKAGSKYTFEVSGLDFLENGTYTATIKADTNKYGVCDTAVMPYKEGLVQLSEDTVYYVVQEMTLEEKASLVLGWESFYSSGGSTYPIPRLGVPVTDLADGPSGLRTSAITIGYPTGAVMASTWDDELVYKITESMGSDYYDFGVEIILGPGMNIQRLVLNGRNFEYFSEDPYLTGKIATSYTKGIQSQGIGVALKHFAVNNQERNRGSVSANVTERALREIYLKGFEYTVKNADPFTIMSSYNRVNGIYTSANGDLLNGILREEWGFKGYVMSDWGAGGGREGNITAGNDIFCGGNDQKGDIATITQLIKKEKISMKQLDACCINLLNVISRTIAMDTDYEPAKEISNADEKRQLVREAGAQGIVLLKNENNALPFNKGEIAFFGTASYHAETVGHGSGDVSVKEKISVFQGLCEEKNITYNEEVELIYAFGDREPFDADTSKDNPANDPYEMKLTQEEAEEAAAESDIAIFTISRLTTEGCDHRTNEGDFLLNERELNSLKLVSQAFHAQGKKVVVIINTGNPIETASWQEYADAILYIGLTGEQLGYSVADVFTGRTNPSGKLACTWPVKYEDVPYYSSYPGNASNTDYVDDIYVGYRYFETFNVPVSYEFGFGLSYTTFEYSDFKVEKNGNNYNLSVTVKNIGKVAGKEAVQFYVTKPDGKNEHPSIELIGYDKTGTLKPGKSQKITITVTEDELKTYYTPDSAWIIEKGEYSFYAAASVKDIRATKKVTINDEIIVQDVENRCEPTEELEVISKNGTYNPALKPELGEKIAMKSASASHIENSNYPAAKAIDGDEYSRWSAPCGGTKATLIIKFEELTDLSCLNIIWESNTSEKFKLYTSEDGENWNLTGEFSYEEDFIFFDTVKANSIKIEITNSQWCSIYEVKAYK